MGWGWRENTGLSLTDVLPAPALCGISRVIALSRPSGGARLGAVTWVLLRRRPLHVVLREQAMSPGTVLGTQRAVRDSQVPSP